MTRDSYSVLPPVSHSTRPTMPLQPAYSLLGWLLVVIVSAAVGALVAILVLEWRDDPRSSSPPGAPASPTEGAEATPADDGRIGTVIRVDGDLIAIDIGSADLLPGTRVAIDRNGSFVATYVVTASDERESIARATAEYRDVEIHLGDSVRLAPRPEFPGGR